MANNRRLQDRSGGDPAAGANFTTSAFTTDKEIIGLIFTLTTDANAANRRPHLIVRESGGSTMYIPWVAAANQTASTGQTYSLSNMPAALSGLGSKVEPLGEMHIAKGGTFRIVIDNIQVGDALTGIRWQERNDA